MYNKKISVIRLWQKQWRNRIFMGAIAKPIKSAQDLVAHMQQKGITFNIVSPDDAANYMRNNNNYFRVASRIVTSSSYVFYSLRSNP
jgi:hypothetical protein